MAIGLGTVSTTGVAELIAKTYDPVFTSLRDTQLSIKKLLFPDTKEGNDIIRWHLDGNDVNKVRSVSETDLNSLITSTILDTSVGSGTPGAGVFLTPNLHPVLEASYDIRHLVQTIMIGSKQLAAIKGGKDSFANILTRETKESLLDWQRGIDDMLLTFTNNVRTATAPAAGNSGKDIDGLEVMLSTGATTPSIYGVNYSTNPEFKPYLNHNSGTPRALSISLLQDVMNKLEAAPAGSTPRYATVDMILAGADQFTNYGNLLTAQRRWTGTETMDGGFQKLEFNGRAFVSVPRFVADKLLFVDKVTPQGEKSYEYRILKNMSTEDKTANIVDGILLVMVHMANALCKGRRQQGILMDLS